jgi:hypothetical protein
MLLLYFEGGGFLGTKHRALCMLRYLLKASMRELLHILQILSILHPTRNTYLKFSPLLFREGFVFCCNFLVNLYKDLIDSQDFK